MKITAIILTALALAGGLVYAGPNDIISGAGATFPYPLYSQWAHQYNQVTQTRVNYQSIGSGGGIRQIKARTVDFGASDAPLEPSDLEASGLFQFPMVIGGDVPVVNLKGIAAGEIKLDGTTLADIYLGKITKWNDPAIRRLNEGLKLPDKAITVVSRADGSGTTWIFTQYLSAVSPEWASKVGVGTSVAWPAGVGGKGNEGVASYVQRIDGAIGYVEYAYALQNNLTYAKMKNRAGKFVAPNLETFMAAAANADWANAPKFYLVLVDQPGDNSWPITGATFILVYREQSDPARAKVMMDYFNWCYNHGSDIAINLHYVPMPANVVKIVQDRWITDIRSGGAPVWTR